MKEAVPERIAREVEMLIESVSKQAAARRQAWLLRSLHDPTSPVHSAHVPE